jgi:hypothetical protein
MGPSNVMKKSLGPATTLYRAIALSFVIPSEAEGSAVPRTFRGNVFLVVERSAVSFRATLTLPDGKTSLDEGHGFSRAVTGSSNEGFSP